MPGQISDDVVAGWIGSLAARAKYLSAHFTVPNWADPTASEVFDPGYARAVTSWSALSARLWGNTDPVTFVVPMGTGIVAVGFHENLADTDMLAYAEAPIGTTITVGTQGLITFGVGEIVLGIM